jgi:hypothetical protein
MLLFLMMYTGLVALSGVMAVVFLLLIKNLNKAKRLHFKSLGGILALQERIAAAFLARQGAAPPAAAG